MPVNDLSQSYTWVPIYQELASKLLEYKNDRKRLLNILEIVYRKIGKPFPKVEKDRKPIDIDPFTVFGFFNNYQTKENRLRVLSQIKEEFHLSSALPTKFDAIPLVQNQKANFFGFVGDRKEEDIDNLWNFFEIALKHASHPAEKTQEAFERCFDLVKGITGVGIGKVTMGPFWIAPNSYLSLDSTMRTYILNSDQRLVNLSEADILDLTGKEYFKLLEEIKEKIQGSEDIHSFLDLSSKAFDYTQESQSESKKSDTTNSKRSYWLYAPGENACEWNDCLENGYMSIFFNCDDLSKYQSYEEVRQAWHRLNTDIDKEHTRDIRALWEFSHIIKEGDVVYAKKGVSTIIGRGVVTERGYQCISNGEHIRFVDWTHKKEFNNPGSKIRKTLTNITNDTEFVNALESEFNVTESLKSEAPPLYTSNDFTKDVYMDEKKYERLKTALKLKKNIVLEGAPGVGKTYIAKRLAYAMMGTKDDSRIKVVQFHQSYSYEDFVMGYRPETNGSFKLHSGAFYKFCKTAEADPDKDYFFIIDEINRGNLSKIFGEMFMLLENDKRGQPMQLLYSDESFSIPKNLYVIGTANTADRSLAMIDYALRRRFAFQRIEPGFSTSQFEDYSRDKINSTVFNKLIENVIDLNGKITDEPSLGSGFCIGHSYFTNLEKTNELEETLKNIVEFELIPLLKEYCFDDPSKLDDWIKILKRDVF